MARYNGAVCRLCRREGTKLFLKGDRCKTEKCSLDRRSYVPGQQLKRGKKLSEYGLQLREKQKAKRIYGLLEKQFRISFKNADRKKGVTGENLLQLLECRMDNVVHRLGFALSRSQSRQLITHNHFLVNSKRVNIPSYQIKKGDIVELTAKSKKKDLFKKALEAFEKAGSHEEAWLSMDKENMRGVVNDIPTREDIKLPIKEQLIVELYSK